MHYALRYAKAAPTIRFSIRVEPESVVGISGREQAHTAIGLAFDVRPGGQLIAASKPLATLPVGEWDVSGL